MRTLGFCLIVIFLQCKRRQVKGRLLDMPLVLLIYLTHFTRRRARTDDQHHHGYARASVLRVLRLLQSTMGKMKFCKRSLRFPDHSLNRNSPHHNSPHDNSPHDNSPHDNSPHSQFAPWTTRPMDNSPQGQLAPWTTRPVTTRPTDNLLHRQLAP
jgi:hypothetical protein